MEGEGGEGEAKGVREERKMKEGGRGDGGRRREGMTRLPILQCWQL